MTPIAKAEPWDTSGKAALMEKAGENPFQPAEDHTFQNKIFNFIATPQDSALQTAGKGR